MAYNITTTTSLKLRMRKFDVDHLVDHGEKAIVVVGQRNTGKSVLARDLLQRLLRLRARRRHRASVGLVGSAQPLAANDGDENEVVVVGAADRDFNLTLTPAAERVTHLTRAGGILVIDGNPGTGGTWSSVVGSAVADRHRLGLTCIVTMDYPSNAFAFKDVDVVFMFCQCNRVSRMRLYREYAHRAFVSFEMFDQVLDQLGALDGWGTCLVLDLAASNRSPFVTDHAFWYKADLEEGPSARASCHERTKSIMSRL